MATKDDVLKALAAVKGPDGAPLTESGKLSDVVVSDVMMPRMSGLELVAALRDDPDTAGIPILLLTAKAQQADIGAGIDAGADDYVTKPFEPLDLVDRVNRLLARTS